MVRKIKFVIWISL